MAPPFTTFPIPTTFAVSEWGLPVNVKDFGAIGDNTADDTAAIQAAIDYAYANNREVIFIPAGQYKITSSLYLDPPGNLRSNFANPPNASFSLTLTGDAGGANHEGDGSFLRATFNNAAALYVGGGQGMRVAHLQIIGPFGLYGGQQNPNGIGVGYCSGGGASRTDTQHVWVENFYKAFMTGANGNGSLNDSNTWYKCVTTNVYMAAHISQSQNFMNTFYDCQLSAQIAIFSAVGAGAHVFGGNLSGGNGNAACFTIGSTTALTATFGANFYHYDFTTTISVPDAFVNTPVYDRYVIKTAHFGLIPLQMTTYAAGVATFRILDMWSEAYYFLVNAKTDTDLEAEIQACTTLYAAESRVVFWGSGIECHGGIHVENAFAPTTLLISAEAIGSQPNNHLCDLFFNVTPQLSELKASGAGTPGIAKFYNAQAWPFIWMQSTSPQVTIQNCMLQMGGDEPVIIQQDSQVARLVVKEMSRFGPIVNRVNHGGGNQGSINNFYNLGGGEWDAGSVSGSTANINADIPGDHWRRYPYGGTSPFWGWRPAAYTRPQIFKANLDQLAGTLPAISASAGNLSINYPLLWGGQIYSVNEYNFATNALQTYEVSSSHHYYTYGQNLTTANVTGLAWSYKGQSFCVYADAATLSVLFAGLGVKLWDGATENLFLVTGVFPTLGYFTTQQITGPIGNKTTVFTSTTNQIGQEPFAIRVVSGPNTPVTKTGDFAPTALENNIIVNKGSSCTVTLPSAATYNGRAITIKTIQAFTVVSASSNVVPITGGSAGTAILAATAGKWAQLVANGTSWEIIQSN